MRRPFAAALVLLVALALVGAPAAATAGAEGPAGSATQRVADGGPTRASVPTPDPATAASVPPGGAQAEACTRLATGEQRPDPEEDVLGWERGCWYDDALAVTYDDGVNATELAAIVSRTMARVEHVRELEFERRVPVEVVSRERYRERQAAAFRNVSTATRLHRNVKLEALFLVGEDTDAIDQIRRNRAGAVLGYYSPRRDRIVVVADGEDAVLAGLTRRQEVTLAHELVHALQDQQFNLTRYDRSTTDGTAGLAGLVEGDARYVDYEYTRRCDEAWACAPTASQPRPDLHWGLYFLSYQPYSDGPTLVRALRDRGGWAAVDAAYDDPPASSEQVVHPDRYPVDVPANVTVADRSDQHWRRLNRSSGIDHAEIGEAGLFTMLYYPSYQSTSDRVVPYRDLFNFEDGGLDRFDPYDYNSTYTNGWEGDRLVPYVTNDSVATNETGYVWRTAWESETDAREFARGYRELLRTRGATPVIGHADTYRIPGDEPYGDAFYVNRTADAVVIVNAPTVAALDGVRAGAAPNVTPTRTPTPTATTAERNQSTPPGFGLGEGSPPGPPPATTPGFGPAMALLALALAALAARRR